MPIYLKLLIYSQFKMRRRISQLISNTEPCLQTLTHDLMLTFAES